MAYDIHIFRGTNWWEETNEPIETEELLSIEGVENVDQISNINPQTGAEIKISDNDMFSYHEVTLRLKKGILTFATRSDDEIETVRPLADALKASIQGDEGEAY